MEVNLGIRAAFEFQWILDYQLLEFTRPPFIRLIVLYLVIDFLDDSEFEATGRNELNLQRVSDGVGFFWDIDYYRCFGIFALPGRAIFPFDLVV